MSLELEFSNVSLNKFTEDKAYIANVSSDIIVPDSKPDVIKIIGENAWVNIKEVSVQKDKITFLGTISYDIVYLSDKDSDRIKSITYQTPFSHQDDFCDFEDGDNIATEVKLLKCNSSVHNSRKINVSTTLEFRPYAIHNQMIDIVGSTQGKYTIPCLEKTISPINRVICCDDRFCIEDILEMDDYEICEIIKTDAVLCERDYKLVSNKTVVRGRVSVSIMFFDENAKIRSVTRDVEFSEVIDARNISRDMIPDICVDIADVKCAVESENENKVQISIDMRVTICAYEEQTINVVYDAYCPDCVVNLTKKELCASELVTMGEEYINVKDDAELSNKQCTKICDVKTNVHIKEQSIESDKLKTSGIVTAEITYIAEDSTMLCTDIRDVSFETYTEAKDCKASDKIRSRAYVSGCDVSLLPSSRAELKMSLVMEHMVLRDVSTEYVSNVEPDEESCFDKEKCASITIYFADKDDTLWDIAKKYHTTINDIAKINNIDEKSILNHRQKLLIPKRR